MRKGASRQYPDPFAREYGVEYAVNPKGLEGRIAALNVPD
jgi:hypothetical protein